MKRGKAAAAVLAMVSLVAGNARAALPGDCTSLGLAITEHSCFHSEFGPFTTVMATPGSAAAASTPDISPVHTEYRVGLTGEQSVVTYAPRRSGAWAVLLGEDVPLQLLPNKGNALKSVLSQSGKTGCAALPVLHVFELTAATPYRLVFGPTVNRTAVVVIEYIDDFLTENGRDADGDGFGSQTEVVVTPCRPPAGFAPNTRDCNDVDPLVNPNVAELCDGLDQNCNGVGDDLGLACHVGAGRCRVEGQTECSAPGNAAECAATPLRGSPESCNGADDDCNGEIDDAPDLCPDAAHPTCVRSGMTAACGCQLDLDCGSLASGRICNVTKGTCEDGCSPEPGRNGCGVGEVCSRETSRCAAADDGVGGAGSTEPAHEGGDGAEPAEQAGAGATGLTPEASSGSTTRGGCDCGVAGAGRSKSSPLVTAALLSWWARRRRAFRRKVGHLAIAGAVIGCGGRVQDTTAIALAGSGGNGAAGARDGEGGSERAGTGAAGASGSPEPACEPVLGEKLVEHACSHVTNGPFVPVVTGGALAPPDVSELHHTYEVQVVGADARLHYRAQRAGGHAFMTDRPASLTLVDAGQLMAARPSFPVEGCPHLTQASVYDLEPEREYELHISMTSSECSLFVEHLGAFGTGAWSEECAE